MLFQFTTLYSPSIGVTVGKLEAAKSVTSAYQQTAGINILTLETGKNIKINYGHTPL
jgi:ethanolamine ammonia-lyase large subunit